MSKDDFIKERSVFRYRDSGYVFSIEAYRDGFGIIIKNEKLGTNLKYFSAREQNESSVVWTIAWGADWNSNELPGTGKTIRELLIDYLEARESGRQVEIVFGQ